MAIEITVPVSNNSAEFAGDIEVGERVVTLTRKLTNNGLAFMCTDEDGARGFLNVWDNVIEAFESNGIDIEAMLTDHMLNKDELAVTCYKAGRCKLG